MSQIRIQRHFAGRAVMARLLSARFHGGANRAHVDPADSVCGDFPRLHPSSFHLASLGACTGRGHSTGTAGCRTRSSAVGQAVSTGYARIRRRLELVANSIRNEQAPTASSPFADWRHALTVAGTANAYPSFAASEPQCALTSQLLVGIDSSSLVEQGVALTWAASADLDTARMGFLNLMLITAARSAP